jgi:predicted phosphodiesterase
MPASKWNNELDSRRIELIQEGYSYAKIAEVLNEEYSTDFSTRAIEGRCYNTKTTKKDLLSATPVKNTSTPKTKTVKTKQMSLFSADSYEMDEQFIFAPEKKRQLTKIYNDLNDGQPKKILSLSDLHAPFIHFGAVEQALLEHNDADILILNGDVFDGNALSDYDKLKDFDIELEFEQVFKLLDVVTNMFEKIYWVGGNHDLSRFIRLVARKFGAGMKNYVLKRLNPIDYIAEKYDNVIVVPHQFMQVGECIFNHPDGYSSALMSTAMGQAKAIAANAEQVLPNPKFTTVVQGHTHDLGEYYVNGTKIIEQGSLCHLMDYRFDKPTSRRWVLGYAVVQLNADGSVDFNNTRNYLAE